MPIRALVGSYEQASGILGSAAAAAADAFKRVVISSAHLEPVRDWALRSPLKAIELADDWPTLLIASDSLLAHGNSGVNFGK